MGYTILGHEPHGIKPKGAKHERLPAIPQELIDGNVELLLHEVKNLVITVLGRQGALSTNIDPGQFHAAIRKRYPVGYYDRSPNQEISDWMNGTMRVASRSACWARSRGNTSTWMAGTIRGSRPR